MILTITKKKIRYYKELGSWGGCLVATEVIDLVEHGAVPTEGSRAVVERCRAMKKAGNCTPLWFYFHVPKKSKAYMELY